MALAALQPLRLAARNFTYTYEGQTVTYTVIDETAKTCMVTSANDAPDHKAISGELILPSNPKDGNQEFTLIKIGFSAFLESGITSLYIPDTVTELGDSFCYNCANLRSIRIGNLVTAIPYAAFWNCQSLEGISLSDNIREIRNFAFARSGITSLDIPDSVTWLGESVCQECFYLSSVRIGNSVTDIYQYAFWGCSSLENVYLGNSVIGVYYGAFAYCTSLKSFTIPDSVQYIQGVFEGCESLEWVLIGESVDEWSISSICYGLPNVKEFKISENSQRFAVKDGVLFNKSFSTLIACPPGLSGDYTIPSTVETIVHNAFSDIESLSSFVIPETVKEIGDYAFSGCNRLSDVTIKGDLPVLGMGVFDNCPMLQTFKIEDENYTVKDGVLFDRDFTKLVTCIWSVGEEYKIPNTVTEIVDGAFVSCRELASIEIPSSVVKIGDSAFDGCPLASVEIPNSVLSMGKRAFAFSNLSTINIPSSITSLSDGIFLGCSKLESISIPNSVTSIGVSAFDGCESLLEVTIPSSITSLSSHIFNRCFKLESISIPNSVISIGEFAFQNCRNLTEVNVPESVMSIGQYAFSFCPNLTIINIPTSITSVEEGVFCGDTNLSSIDIPKSVAHIGKYAFQDCSSLTEVSIPEGMVSMDIFAFNRCRSLSTITLPASLKEIGGFAFANCENLEKVYAPGMEGWMGISFANETANPLYYGAELMIDSKSTNVVEISEDTQEVSDYAFAGLSSLAEVVISESVDKIGNGSFTGTGIENITIPQNVKTIGDKAFQNCQSLKSAVIGKITGKLTRAGEVDKLELSTVGSEAFAGCAKLEKVSFGSNVGSIGEKAFEGCGSIAQVDCYSLLAPEAAEDAFDPAALQKAVLHVPAGYADVFESAPVWSLFSEIVDDLIAPETLALDTETLKLGVGTTRQLNATSSAEGSLTWESSDDDVATVSAEGLVSAVQEGIARITVIASSGARAYCDVTVVKIEATGIGLSKTTAVVVEGESLELTATITPADATDQTVTWSSSDEIVATVDQDGIVTALKAGKAIITARTANGKEATCEVIVEAETGIDGVEGDAQIGVAAGDGVIIVTAPEAAGVEVYSMTGVRVAKTMAHSIDGLASGVYVVRVGGKTFKVMVR